MAYVVTYLFVHMLVALSLGALFLQAEILLPFGSWCRFFLGVSITPLTLGLISFLIGVIPGCPSSFFLFLPVALALTHQIFFNGFRTLLVFFKSTTIKINSLKQNMKKVGTVAKLVILFIAFVILVIPLSKSMYIHVRTPVNDHDASHYLMQARYFAEDRNSVQIDNYTGDKAGTVLPDDHGPLWTTYLGQALMFHPNGYQGYPWDATARVAIVITIPYMLLGLSALALAVRYDANMVLLSIAFLLFEPTFSYISNAYSRDGFKLIALCAVTLVLFAFAKRSYVSRGTCSGFGLKDFLLLFLMSFFSIQGHSGNLFSLFPMAVFFGVFLLCMKTPVTQIFFLFISGMAGIAFGLIKNIFMYFNRGSFRSYTSFYTAGTEYQATVRRASLGFFEGLKLYVDGPVFFCVLLGILGLLFIIINFYISARSTLRNMRIFPNALIFAVLSLCSFIPFTGLFDFAEYHISEWFLLNFRYQLHFYIFVSILAAWFVVFLLDHLRQSLVLFLATSATLLSICAYSAYTVKRFWPNEYTPIVAWEQDIQLMANTCVEVSKGQNILINYESLNYNFSKPAIILPGEKTVNLMHANSSDDLNFSLKALDIKVVVLHTQPNIEQSALYKYLSGSQDVQQLDIDFQFISNFKVFVL